MWRGIPPLRSRIPLFTPLEEARQMPFGLPLYVGIIPCAGDDMLEPAPSRRLLDFVGESWLGIPHFGYLE